MSQDANLHSLTHVVINDLLKAFKACHDRSTEGLILSAMVTAKKVHDQLIVSESNTSDFDPEEYCAAI
jgi:hypothetical protein